MKTKENKKKKVPTKPKSKALKQGSVSSSKKNYCCERRKISKKEREDFTKACIELLFGSSDGLQKYTDKYL